jgi:hypothetical protein
VTHYYLLFYLFIINIIDLLLLIARIRARIHLHLKEDMQSCLIQTMSILLLYFVLEKRGGGGGREGQLKADRV